MEIITNELIAKDLQAIEKVWEGLELRINKKNEKSAIAERDLLIKIKEGL